MKRDLETHFPLTCIVSALERFIGQRQCCKDKIEIADVFQAKYFQKKRERFNERFILP